MAVYLIKNKKDDIKNVCVSCDNDEDDEVKKNALIAIYNLVGRDILDEVIELPIYTKYLKEEAQALIDEYEVEDYE